MVFFFSVGLNIDFYHILLKISFQGISRDDFSSKVVLRFKDPSLLILKSIKELSFIFFPHENFFSYFLLDFFYFSKTKKGDSQAEDIFSVLL